MLGRAVGAGGLGFGVVRDEHASAINNSQSNYFNKNIINNFT